ncbi:DHHC palmitoyltransferase [Giardia muris]|uniref:Palmitoyltransferase n=1 Tax=Giardia muris TaxID=5742 RepID=A0A4Z1SXY6_GIAMU|nr:DHHC palmitoyltransferase [Giardia muris]|eukprot:TNJ30556.1 DHHC palmitoyltransferase [Giardia muris]
MPTCLDRFFCTTACKRCARNQTVAAQKFVAHFIVILLLGANLMGVVEILIVWRNTIATAVVATILTYILIVLLVHFELAAWLDPGSVPTNYNGIRRKCLLCDHAKPIRTHHCQVCKRCILKYDHHCPWIGNCVGLNNYGHFWSFLLWAIIAQLLCVVFNAVCTGLFFTRIRAYLPIVSATIGLIAVIGVITLFQMHVTIIRRNLTTIEYYSRKETLKEGRQFLNPYDRGSAMRNFREVIPDIWKIFIPVRIWPEVNGLWTFCYEKNVELAINLPPNVYIPASQYRTGEGRPISPWRQGPIEMAPLRTSVRAPALELGGFAGVPKPPTPRSLGPTPNQTRNRYADPPLLSDNNTDEMTPCAQVLFSRPDTGRKDNSVRTPDTIPTPNYSVGSFMSPGNSAGRSSRGSIRSLRVALDNPFDRMVRNTALD